MKTIIDKTVKDIKDIKIQGATNVAKESVKALGIYTSQISWKFSELKKEALKLTFARPTEPLTQNCIKWFLSLAKNKQGENLTKEANDIVNSLIKSRDLIIKSGVDLIKNNTAILTHCHSSTVTGILREAHKAGKKFKVYLTETRPYYQGHITANELVKSGINATMMADSQAAFVISREDQIEINSIFVGADSIDLDGSALNKVGSYGLSLSAKQANIPFFVTATILKFSTKEIPIEVRSEDEVWDSKPDKLKILNLAFDRIPSKNISSYITEFGLIKPIEIPNTVKKHYPWIFNE